MFERNQAEEMFLRAIKTLMVMPDREISCLAVKGTWPAYAREYMDAYETDTRTTSRFRPTAADVSVYLEVLSWGNDLDRLSRQLMFWRASDASFRRMGDLLGVSHENARMRYVDAVDQIWSAANASQVENRASKA